MIRLYGRDFSFLYILFLVSFMWCSMVSWAHHRYPPSFGWALIREGLNHELLSCSPTLLLNLDLVLSFLFSRYLSVFGVGKASAFVPTVVGNITPLRELCPGLALLPKAVLRLTTETRVDVVCSQGRNLGR